MLRSSRGAEVIEDLTKLRDSGEHPVLRADLQGEIGYFTANQQRIDGRRYRSDHQRLLPSHRPGD